MTSKVFTDFFRHNLQFQHSLENLRNILARSFGIDDFWHLTVYENGHLANVSTSYDQWAHMWGEGLCNRINFLIAPSRLKDASFLLEYDADFVEITNSFKDKFAQYHPFILVRKEGEKAHIFGFASRSYKPGLPSFYLNNIAILNNFLNHYLSTNTKFTRHSPEHMIDIAELRGP